MEKTPRLRITSAALHILAMVFMLCDHLWGTVVPGNDWLTCVGRLAFPIFAFLIVEGYFHTRSLKKYVLRLLIAAVISEIPFNLAMGSSWFYPIHQNVLWTFLIAIGLIRWNEKVREKKLWLRILVGIGSVLVGYLGGIITMVDYFHAGVLTVLAFYVFRQRKWWGYAGQAACMWYINLEILKGLVYEIPLGDATVTLAQQGFALLALIPIWLYRGERGHHSKAFRYFCYLFYPAHLLLLGLLKLL